MKVTYDAQVCIHAGNCIKSSQPCSRWLTGSLSLTNKVQVKLRFVKRLPPARLAHCRSRTIKF
jgi:hypothetical protein